MNKCTGCLTCADNCPKLVIKIRDSVIAYNAVSDEKKYIDCVACYKVCQVNTKPEKLKLINWKQGGQLIMKLERILHLEE